MIKALFDISSCSLNNHSHAMLNHIPWHHVTYQHSVLK